MMPTPQREDLALWLSEMMRSLRMPIPVHTILHDQESAPMIAETMERYRQQLLAEGREEGREEGRVEVERMTS